MGGLLTQSLGWRGVFLVQIPLAMALLAAAYFRLPTLKPTSQLVAFDWKGLGAYAIFLVGVMYGLTELPELTGYVFLVAGTLGFFLLIHVEKGNENPLVHYSVPISPSHCRTRRRF
ncbi:hypothetical protein ACFLUT_03930 [Chloroflexota bacterium]